jgi:hypothetical protein
LLSHCKNQGAIPCRSTPEPKETACLARRLGAQRRFSLGRLAAQRRGGPEVPNTTGAEALIGERLDGIEKVAGAIPVSSTASNAGEDYITIMVLR